MKVVALLIMTFIAGCAERGSLPSPPFTFTGLAVEVSRETFQSVDGVERGLRVKVLEMKKGRYGGQEISFGFPYGSPAPLEPGKKYLITAAWGRHGMLLLKAVPQTTD